MSKLTDRISYLQGLAEGMKLNPDKDSHKLILEMLDVLGDVGAELEAQQEAHDELDEYVMSIDEDLADLEAELYDDDDEFCSGDCANCEEDCEADDEDFEDDADDDDDGVLVYECPHCGHEVEFEPEDVDFDENAKCPECGGELFPELPLDEVETAEIADTDKPE
ncbi:MAG: phage terminase large subunit family protein [Clostridia bacterium]|nr:phage terminase large subunit family protein [Clostridia bacterium]